MPLVSPKLKLDFLRRQVLMSRNITGGPLISIFMGGLNYQVEHHLFPSMARPHLRKIQSLVATYCADEGVPYTQTSLWQSYRTVIGYLNTVGLKGKDPFLCPSSPNAAPSDLHVLIGYALMTLPSPELPSNRLRPGQVSGPRRVLTDSAPALPEVATRPWCMPPTAAPRDLAYTRALAAASQRMWAASDVAALWRAVVDEAVALIAADGAAVVTIPSASGKPSPHARATRRRMIRRQLR